MRACVRAIRVRACVRVILRSKNMWCFKDTNQMSELDTYEFVLPKYPESTTDPTYYEPTATRIANMRKSASSTKSLYDFEGDDAKVFVDSKKALSKISSAQVDPRFNNNLTREEVSQVTTDLGENVQNVVNKKKDNTKKLKEEVQTALEVQKVLETTKQNNSTSEE